mgnify:CR=1 FL=1
MCHNYRIPISLLPFPAHPIPILDNGRGKVTIKSGVRVNLAFTNRNWVTGKTHIVSALQTLKKGLMVLLEIKVMSCGPYLGLRKG